MKVLLGRVILIVGLCFHYLEYFLPFPLGYSVSVEKSAGSLIRETLFITSCFTLAAFQILPLSLIFAILIMMCFGVGLFGFILIGTLCVSWTCMTFSTIKLGKFSVITFSNRFSPLLLLVSLLLLATL